MKYARTLNANDNNDPWQTLAAATARVLEAHEQKKEEARENDERKRKQEREREEYIEHRIRELAAFERRARGWHC